MHSLTHTHPTALHTTTAQIKSLNISSPPEVSLLPNWTMFIFLSHPGSLSVIMQKPLWGPYSLWHFIFLSTEGEKQMWHLLYILQKFTTWLWQGRTLSCWASPVPGAGAGWWKAGVQSRKSDLPTQIFLPDVGVCCSNCAYPVPPMLPLGAHTGLPLGSRRTLSVPGPIRAEPEVGVGWWYQAFCRWTQAAPAPRGLV